MPHTPRPRDTGPRPRPLRGLLIGRGAVTVLAAAFAAACGRGDSKVGTDSAAGDPPSITAYAHARDCAAALVAADNCQGCHQADPWLHSPWIDQLRDPVDPAQPLVPVVEGADAPYIVVGADFAQPFHEGAPDNTCTSCHRAQCDNGFAEPLGQLVMPGPFAESRFHPEVSDDLRAVRAWCESLPNGGVGGPDGSQDEDSVCDEFIGCFEGCSDTECAASCAAAHLEGAPLATAQALLACMDAAGCRLDDEACIFGACPDEAEAFFEACGYDQAPTTRSPTPDGPRDGFTPWRPPVAPPLPLSRSSGRSG